MRVRVPARDVILATQRPEGLSLHNILEGRVTSIGLPPNGREDDRDRDHALVQVTLGAQAVDTDDAVRLLAGVTRDAVARLQLVVRLADLRADQVGLDRDLRIPRPDPRHRP